MYVCIKLIYSDNGLVRALKGTQTQYLLSEVLIIRVGLCTHVMCIQGQNVEYLLSRSMYVLNQVQLNLVKMKLTGLTKLILIIRSSSYQDIVIHVQYYSKPNRAQKLVCAKQKFVLRVFFLMRFYCTVTTI